MVPLNIEYHVKNVDGVPIGKPRIYLSIPFAACPTIGTQLIFSINDAGWRHQLEGRVAAVIMTAGEPAIKVILVSIQAAAAMSKAA